MLKLTLPQFEDLDPVELNFEHSLVSMSKWEAMYERPFYSNQAQTVDESYEYIICMLQSPYNLEHLRARLNPEHIKLAHDYINSTQSATTFRTNPNEAPSREIMTTELVYYWLTIFQIPFSPVEDWHFNRLMTLIRIYGIKQTKQKKMTPQEMAEQNRRLNDERRAKLGTNG